MGNKGVIYLLFFSLLTGFGSYFVKITQGISSMQILFYRSVFATLFLFVLSVVLRQTQNLKIKFPVITFIMGLTEGLSIYFYYLALEKTTIANSVLLVYTAPVFSALFSYIFLKEKIAKNTIIAILCSLLGVIIIVNPGQIKFGENHLLGSVYALLGGLFYSAMAISSKVLTHKTTPIYSAFWQYFLIMLLSILFVLPIQINHITTNIIPLTYLGWLAGGLAFFLFMKGISNVKGQIIQIITMIEILISSLSGILLLGESVTIQTIIGGIFILVSIYVVAKK